MSKQSSHSVQADEMVRMNYEWLENQRIKPVTITLPRPNKTIQELRSRSFLDRARTFRARKR